MAAFSVYFANCKNFPEYKIVKFAGFYMAPMNFFTILHNAIFGAGSSAGDNRGTHVSTAEHVGSSRFRGRAAVRGYYAGKNEAGTGD